MPPKVFVVLVVMRLGEVAVNDDNALPVAEVGIRDIYTCLNTLVNEVGLVPNLGSLKLVDVISADDGTLLIAYRIRTRAQVLAGEWRWVNIDVDLGGKEERRLLDRAWELEKP